MTKNPWRDLVVLTDVEVLAERLTTPSYWPPGSACSELVKEEVTAALRAEVISPTECIVLVARLYDVSAVEIADFLHICTRAVNLAFERACGKLNAWSDCGVTTVLVEAFGRCALDVIE